MKNSRIQSHNFSEGALKKTIRVILSEITGDDGYCSRYQQRSESLSSSLNVFSLLTAGRGGDRSFAYTLPTLCRQQRQ